MLFEKLVQQYLRRKRGSTGAPRLSATSKRLLEPPTQAAPAIMISFRRWRLEERSGWRYTYREPHHLR